ncbi:unnamed protein product [Effrenium voratum]|nr:unnamed protein product [Effrenium voratum]
MAFRRLGLPLRGETAGSAPVRPKIIQDEAKKANGGISEAPAKAKLVVASSAAKRAARPLLRPRQEVDETGPGRGRNLLSSVMVHLSSARDRLQADQSEAKGVVKTIVKPRLRKQLIARRRVSEKEKPAQAREEDRRDKLLEARIAEHYSHMMQFIRTKTEPILFYLPAKHNPETQKCLQETQETIQRKIQDLSAHLAGAGAEEVEEEEEESQDPGPKVKRRAALTPAKP